MATGPGSGELLDRVAAGDSVGREHECLTSGVAGYSGDVAVQIRISRSLGDHHVHVGDREAEQAFARSGVQQACRSPPDLRAHKFVPSPND